VEADEMIRSFTRLPFLAAARGLQRENLLGLENLEQWSIEGVPVWVKIDFAYRDPARRVRILDWKTGKHERGENPLQMVGYALYAEQRWGAALESLDVLEVYLRQDPPERPCALDRSVLERGLATIRSSIAAMLSRLSDPQQNRAEESNFELAADEWACRNCPFRAICPRWEGR
jgi:CRISPR/Cas system-associated exonuclease Cas4 (RecB family)